MQVDSLFWDKHIDANMITPAVIQVVAEGLTLGMEAGLDLDALMEAGSRGILGTQKEGVEIRS